MANADPSFLKSMPEPGPARRRWFQDELAKHTNSATAKPWTQVDVATKAACSQGLVSRVLEGRRTTGDLTTTVQRIVAKVLNVNVGQVFGHVCTQCPNCGAEHAPRRALAATGVE
jgi:hypothetical protein